MYLSLKALLYPYSVILKVYYLIPPRLTTRLLRVSVSNVGIKMKPQRAAIASVSFLLIEY